jgi:transcription termination factor Rho
VLRNHKDVWVVVLLIDERPEEVTDFKRTFASIGGPAGAGTSVFEPDRCRVLASSNDHGVERHIEVAMQTIDTCKRLCEAGKHVVVVLDSLTRLGPRIQPQSRKHASSGRTLTGGLDSRALEVPKLLFGAARNSEEAGSLTIIASCLVDTGSAGDQIIFEEFKGTGNMELILDRKISERRIFPSINLAASGTRKEHLLMSEREMNTMTALRRRLLQMPPPMQIEQLLNALKRFKTNDELVGSAG